MFRPLTIFGKGILVVSIPLLTQAVFIGMLIKSASDDALAQRWAVHTKKVIAKIEESYRRFLDGYSGVRDLIVLEHPAPADGFRQDLARAPEALSELRALVGDNPRQQERVDDLIVEERGFTALLSQMDHLAAAGERALAAQHLDEAAGSLAVLRKKIDALLAEEVRLDQERMDRINRANAWHFWLLAGGGAATVLVTLALAVPFLQQVVSRLGVLHENTRRLAEGRGLERPLTGQDELALVDHAFHEMAASLDVQKQENEMFVYSVSHDLRSPLINLQGFSQELKETARDLEALFERDGVPREVLEQGKKLVRQNVAESVHYIQAAVDRLSRIIDALLRLSRAGRVQYQWQTLDVNAIIGKVLDALHDSIREKNAQIVVNPVPEACGDPTAVEQIFANLLGNALKYLDPARTGQIEVGNGETASGTTPAGQRLYYVKDNGLGISEAYHGKVFTAFNRLHASVAPGEGIGLALVRRVVERHRGSIWLESSPGVGTTFFLTLPSYIPDRGLPDDARAVPASRNS
jgi:signal transduction histidine kinase